MKPKDLIKKLAPYCDSIVKTQKHYKLYIKGIKIPITFSCTPSDRNWYRQVIRDFRRYGIYLDYK